MELWEIRQASIPILGLSMGDAHNELTLLHLRFNPVFVKGSCVMSKICSEN